jgi:hypothetical protein
MPMKSLVLACLVALATIAIAASARAEPPTSHEILTDRPSGFWTSNRPAVGGAYRYRLLGIGVVIVGVTGFLLFRTLRKASSDR